MHYKCILASLLLFAISCQSTTNEEGSDTLPDYLIAEQQLIPILMDIHLAEVAHQNWRYSRNKDTLPKSDSISMSEYYQTILTLHQTSPQQFDQTFSYYEARPEQFDRLYTKVVEQLSRLETSVQAQVPKTKEIKAPTKPIEKPNMFNLQVDKEAKKRKSEKAKK